MEYIYASLLLKTAGKEISEENVRRVLEAAGVDVDEVRVKALVAALSKIDIDRVLSTALTLPSAPAAAPAAPSPQPAEEKKAEEEKKEEVSEEDLSAGLSSLFG
ncbi:MAG: 50S ribosomal protein P1 [Sulfolobales archaeon]|nr:50S ribosomal protein P1 [Sulfolobales archaeon]MCX8199503.1 50S ribosomal protein P1 [Sulfolobales archaeon]MDW8170456.1 50S ribosomal protein P1 [Desulfurococcaceae archaeon]